MLLTPRKLKTFGEFVRHESRTHFYSFNKIPPAQFPSACTTCHVYTPAAKSPNQTENPLASARAMVRSTRPCASRIVKVKLIISGGGCTETQSDTGLGQTFTGSIRASAVFTDQDTSIVVSLTQPLASVRVTV